MAGYGLSFQPGQQNVASGSQDRKVGGPQPQSAIELLNLRLPSVVGPSAIAPQALLQSPGGMGLGGSPNAALLLQALAALSGAQLPPMAQGGQIGHLTRGGTQPMGSPQPSSPWRATTMPVGGPSRQMDFSSPMRSVPSGGDRPAPSSLPIPRITPQYGPGGRGDGPSDTRGNVTPPNPVGPPPPRPGEVVVEASQPAIPSSPIGARPVDRQAETVTPNNQRFADPRYLPGGEYYVPPSFDFSSFDPFSF